MMKKMKKINIYLYGLLIIIISIIINNESKFIRSHPCNPCAGGCCQNYSDLEIKTLDFYTNYEIVFILLRIILLVLNILLFKKIITTLKNKNNISKKNIIIPALIIILELLIFNYFY